MGNYLETIYFRNEYGKKDYPQQLCDYIVENYFPQKGNLENKNLLDIGSGKGNHLLGFSRHGLNVFGIDKRKECIEVLKNYEIKECNIEKDKFPYENDSFDFVFSKSVLEHVNNTDNFLSETFRVLKPNGIAVLMTPDWNSQHKFFWDDYTHVKAFTRKSLQNAMLINGFKCVECVYFLQLPIIWKFPILKLIAKLVNILPDALKWKDREEREFRTFIRFSKEKMLIASGTKPNE